MNFEDNGDVLCLVEDDDIKGAGKYKELFIGDPKKCATPMTELKLKDKPSLHFVPCPNKKTERSIRYVTGASGSGKSYWTRAYCEQYHRLYPKRSVYVISSLTEDPTLDKLKYLKRIKLNNEFLMDDIPTEEFKDSLIIFDDTDCLQSRGMKMKVDGILNAVLETGRHFNIEVVYTSHLACNGKETRRILNECKSVTIFPSGLGGKSMKYLLDNYFGLDKEQIKRIKKLNSRWVTICKGFPMSVISDKECFVLNSTDDSDDEPEPAKKVGSIKVEKVESKKK
jgi:hypothetical protein